MGGGRGVLRVGAAGAYGSLRRLDRAGPPRWWCGGDVPLRERAGRVVAATAKHVVRDAHARVARTDREDELDHSVGLAAAEVGDLGAGDGALAQVRGVGWRLA